METIHAPVVDKNKIDPKNLEHVDFSPIYFNINDTGYRTRKPFNEVVEILPAEKKAAIISYLKSAEHCGVIMGPQIDEKNGGEIPGSYLIFSDEVFAWTTKTIHHFERYDMKLPEEFISHILEQENR